MKLLRLVLQCCIHMLNQPRFLVKDLITADETTGLTSIAEYV